MADWGLDELGLGDIKINYNSNYPCHIEEQLQFKLDENSQEWYRYGYAMSVSFNAPKYKEYSLKRLKIMETSSK